MVRIFSATFICHVLALPATTCALSTSVKNVAPNGAVSNPTPWSDMAIKVAKDFTISQRKKLAEFGVLDVQRPMKIIGTPVDDNGNDNDEVFGDKITKTIHLQRHGQGFHNLICDMWREKNLRIDFDSSDPDLNPVVREEFLDPPLTETGRRQSKDRRIQCATLSPQLVIVSPLLRCIQTAKLSFVDHLPSANGKNDPKSTNYVPWVAHEGCREDLGLLVGSKRRPISDIVTDHPDIDFSAIDYDEDVLWETYGMRRETLLEQSERIYNFMTEYVRNRPEQDIAIVTHSTILFTLLNAVMDIESEDLRSWFLTSEVRSMTVTFEVNDQHGQN
mmetsp:Transcript_11375/g.26768  ORF Transcript_11375/g.26768 Transcript_11375/m.26768 type:complete len:332 (+) Transcript_11375:156-1151(+)